MGVFVVAELIEINQRNIEYYRHTGYIFFTICNYKEKSRWKARYLESIMHTTIILLYA